ncbi:MAG TPA: succinyl-diaminopimelate desuccinylase [Acidimicrobiales bacterium]
MTGSTDLLALAAELVAIESVSRHEGELVAWLVDELSRIPGLELTRVGDNLVARTDLGRPLRLVLAGHTDTVPPNGNIEARLEGDRLSGLGSADMKGGLAVMVELARTVADPAVDLTFVFYAREEVAAAENGLRELLDLRPDLLVADAAILGEPTSSAIELGCQGTLRVEIVLVGERAHTARPWMGRNALHRAGPLLTALAAYAERRPVLQGCAYREALQAVLVEGGVAGNVVPDRVRIVLNHRFAPDRTPEQAEAHVREVVDPFLTDGDTFEVVDLAPAAAPSLDHPLVATLAARHGLDVKAKLGWTDVARFAELGVPAINFGPGDPTIAHTAGEFVTRSELDAAFAALDDLVRWGVDSPGSP